MSQKSRVSDDGRFVEFQEEGESRKVGYSFFRGDNTNFYPSLASAKRKNGVLKFVMQGWTPQEPFIDESTKIVAFGSCFADNISKYLNGLGFDVLTKKDKTAYISSMGDGFVHPDAILGQFEWAWEGKQPSANLWHGYDAVEFGYDERIRTHTRILFDRADMFIITLGLSEVWYDSQTNEVFWRAVPREHYDATRHKFRVNSFAEMHENLRSIYDLIRKHNPSAKILFTISPIPLAATFRPVSCITASEASKAILRAAVDELYRSVAADDKDIFYFPSYEICKTLFMHPFGQDGRHILPYILNLNMNVFERYFCKTGKTDDEISALYLDAQNKDKMVAAEGLQVMSAWE